MPLWLEILLEIIKLTIPALIVFFTAYFLLKTYLEKQIQARSIEQRGELRKESVSLRLQAYERLVLFLERIDVPQLLMRISPRGYTAEDFKNALMVTIQKEYEHNLSQQVYVSGKLWEILQVAKDEYTRRITELAVSQPADASGQDLSRALVQAYSEWEKNPLALAKEAVKKEAGLLL